MHTLQCIPVGAAGAPGEQYALAPSFGLTLQRHHHCRTSRRRDSRYFPKPGFNVTTDCPHVIRPRVYADLDDVTIFHEKLDELRHHRSSETLIQPLAVGDELTDSQYTRGGSEVDELPRRLRDRRWPFRAAARTRAASSRRPPTGRASSRSPGARRLCETRGSRAAPRSRGSAARCRRGRNAGRDRAGCR